MRETDGVRVEIVPRRLGLVVPRGTELLDLLSQYRLVVDPCGGHGLCRRCRVRWVSVPPRPTKREADRLTYAEIADGWRLACQHALTEDARIWVAPLQSSVDWKTCGQIPLAGGPRVVERRVFAARTASGPAARSWADELCATAGTELHWSRTALAEMAGVRAATRQGSRIALYTSKNEVLGACPADESPAPHGLAVDIGTSVIGLYLVDLEAAGIVASESLLNPQAAYGADVLSRIAYVQSHGPQGQDLLGRLLRQELDAAIGHLAASAGINRRAVFHLRVVGNSTMLHLFFGVDPRCLGGAPFEPVFSGIVRCSAPDVGLTLAEGARVDSLPGVSGFVGADAVAGALCARLGDVGETALLMDVGTNAELVLAHKGRLFACSAAAGPALESTVFGHGAGLGIDPDDHEENSGEPASPSSGLDRGGVARGSALLDLLPSLLDSGAVREDGRIRGGCGVLSQRVIRQLQLGIAALRSGVEHLLAATDVRAQDVSRVVVSGSFGVRLDPRTMVRIGLLPSEWRSRVQALENAAGLGAAQTLVDETLMDKAVALAAAAHSVPLGGSEEYVQRFVRAMAFPPPNAGEPGKEI
jgi:uncharacterized 2Fe-2S/4Fe-4S cluster protein (DUF4445 family)